MEPLTWAIIAVVVIVLIILVKNWISIYNKFVYWYERAKRKLSDIDVIMQQRLDMVIALAQVVKKYDIHEYKLIKDTIEARSRWSKDADINSKVKAAQEIDNAFLKIQAVFERYPKSKADALHQSLMGHGNLSRVESRLRETRLGYNHIAQQYNERVQRFPRNIVAMVHGFKVIAYLNGPQDTYNPKEIFND
jgi:LemA protein